MQQVFSALATIGVGVFACVAYFWGSNALLDALLPARGARSGRNINLANSLRPWLFLFPALLALGLYLVYPVFNSIWLSFHDQSGENFVGFANFAWLFADSRFHESILNNALWLLVVPAASTLLGLLAAGITDRISWGNIAKSLIFMPMAISFVGAAVIWKFIYDFSGYDIEEIGLLNALVVFFGGDAQAWITIAPRNSFFLMAVLIWIQTGFAMVIISAALRAIPEETTEAAVLDGASPMQVFWKIQVPQIWTTLAVVWTTITILVLKVFDIVLAMTNGQWGSQVLANLMFDWMFRGNDSGRASSVALVIMLLVIPIMVVNMRNTRRESSR